MSLLLLSGNWKHSGEVKSSVNGNVYPTAQRRYATFFKHVLTSYCWPLTALYALYRKTYYYCCYPCWQVQLFLAPFPHRTCLVEKSDNVEFNNCPFLLSFRQMSFFFFFFVLTSVLETLWPPLSHFLLHKHHWIVSSTYSIVADITNFFFYSCKAKPKSTVTWNHGHCKSDLQP